MTTYRCDIGTWERGRRVEIRAASPQEAVNKAAKMLRDDDDYVVEVFEKKSGRCVYDYMNLFSIYEETR